MNKLIEIFIVALKLGVTSFGGPIAHLGYFRDEYVVRRKWLSESLYQDIVSLCQILPGPASSQVGMAIGLLRGGILGAVAAFLGFTLPSVIALIFIASLFIHMERPLGFTKGLMLVAVAVVLHALIGMGKKALNDVATVVIALVSLIVVLFFPVAWAQLLVIILSGVIGMLLFKVQPSYFERLQMNISKRVSNGALLILLLLLIGLPLLSMTTNNEWVKFIDKLYQAGLLVFGGGHVVLPLLQSAFVPEITLDQFLAGYGVTQAMPGPLFTFSSYIGTVMSGVMGGIIGMIAIFLPAMLLVVGTLPYFADIRSNRYIASALKGINAGVIGILGAAFINPILKHTIINPLDALFACLLFIMLQYGKIAPWLVVTAGLIIGIIFYR
ncbi:chromate efflux transporter [Macrococcoides canis]|uniref:chromate efflux transporter n=1 Tax=Macrococcoides canis TaxID=1855823 RepID=UPI00207D36C3|nr:chromate efflux transporter [Macrococcus canis]MCO4097540.1 chromate efflux transporter [Macrococcus canis]UTH09640.1 chromate efflux transporter [Macrococcus canis]